jgi:hypothetical protein
MQTLMTWLLAFIAAHATPAPKCSTVNAECSAAVADVDNVRIAAAQHALAVAMDPDEAPLFAGPDGRAKTALELLAIATHESGLQPRLWNNVCRPRECDGGRATGELQLHLGKYGVELVTDRWIRPCTQIEQANCIDAADVQEDHRKAFIVALHMLRGGGLEGYTGQPTAGPAPTWIRKAVSDWVNAHPVPVAVGLD